MDQGNTHFAQTTRGGGQIIVVVGDEMLAPECPYGFTRLFDATDPANIGREGFAAEHSPFEMFGFFDGAGNMLDATQQNELHIYPEDAAGNIDLAGSACLMATSPTSGNGRASGCSLFAPNPIRASGSSSSPSRTSTPTRCSARRRASGTSRITSAATAPRRRS